MKKIYLIHCWGGGSEANWYPWIKSELSAKGFEVVVFDMPDTENPKIEQWVKFMEENVKDVDEETYFIGHSIGCQTILRYLEKLHKHNKVGGCVFVAPWLDLIYMKPEEVEIAHPWINTKIDFSRVLDHCDNFLCFFSSDDPYVSLKEIKIFQERLGAETVVIEKKGHFDDEIQPRVLEETLKFL